MREGRLPLDLDPVDMDSVLVGAGNACGARFEHGHSLGARPDSKEDGAWLERFRRLPRHIADIEALETQRPATHHLYGRVRAEVVEVAIRAWKSDHSRAED